MNTSLGAAILRVLTDEYMTSGQQLPATVIAQRLGEPLADVLARLQDSPYGVVIDASGPVLTYGPSRECVRAELRIADRQLTEVRRDLVEAQGEIARLERENETLREITGTEALRGRIDLGMVP